MRLSLNIVAQEAIDEAMRAAEKWPAYHSAHESFGVLAEEVAEYFDEVRANNPTRQREELIQIIAVALRAAAGV